MSTEQISLLPTTVIGSHALPSWFWTAIQSIDNDEYGPTDINETFNDAVTIAIQDQEQAGIDIISDGEMQRWYFVQKFYSRMKGLENDPPLRKVGIYGYDTPPRYHNTSRIEVPNGLGIVEEFLLAKTKTNKPIKATCPGPLTLTMHIRPQKPYTNRLDLANEFAEVINLELKKLVTAGANYIQLDEPSFAVIPGELDDWVNLFNKATHGVNAKIALHICFGNLGSRPRGKRTYEWMFPKILDTKSDQLVLEYANREMSEINLWKKFNVDKELGAGVIDIKSFYIETPEDVAERIDAILQYCDPSKLYINPDCGFFQLPRWVTIKKLEAMVKGTKIIRQKLLGKN